MEKTDWQKQTTNDILFPELQWSRPQNSRQAGKLLIIGGSQQNFSAIAETYNQVSKAGIGSARVVLPRSLQRTIGNLFPEAIFVPATPSGSFSSASTGELLVESVWADAVLLAGSLGNNSETAIAIESFVSKLDESLIISGDSIELLMAFAKTLVVRRMTTLVLRFSQLQRLLSTIGYKIAVTSNMNLLQIVTIVHDFTKQYPINIVTEYADNILIAVDGKISTTKIPSPPLSPISLTAFLAVWLIQNSSKPFEALSTATIALLENNK